MDISQILVSSISGTIAAIITIIVTLRIENAKKKRLKKGLINSLREELGGNLRIINKTLTQNGGIVNRYSEEEIQNNEIEIGDEREIYISEHIDIPIEKWVDEDIDRFYPNFPKSDLINYKLALYRSKFLISRNKAFKYRPHFLFALDKYCKELKDKIEILQRSLDSLR